MIYVLTLNKYEDTAGKVALKGPEVDFEQLIAQFCAQWEGWGEPHEVDRYPWVYIKFEVDPYAFVEWILKSPDWEKVDFCEEFLDGYCCLSEAER